MVAGQAKTEQRVLGSAVKEDPALSADDLKVSITSAVSMNSAAVADGSTGGRAAPATGGAVEVGPAMEETVTSTWSKKRMEVPGIEEGVKATPQEFIAGRQRGTDQAAMAALKYGSLLTGGGAVVGFARGSLAVGRTLSNISLASGTANDFLSGSEYSIHKLGASIGSSALLSKGGGLADRVYNTIQSGSSFFVTSAMD